MNSATDLDRQQ